MVEEQDAPAAAEGFVGGVKAAALSIRAVLARKVDVGIITEATARAIFEDTGIELQMALEAYFAEGDK